MKRFISLFLCLCMLSIPAQAENNQKMVALTFDDGPSGRFTRKLLEGLEERDAKATFLLCGYRMEVYPELTERIFREGHEIGLHGYTHNAMQTMCRTEVTMEIEKGMELLPDGCEVAFMRSPGGLYSKCVVSAAADQGLSLLHWSVDPQDWEVHNKAAIEKAVLEKVTDGDIILLHDMSGSSVQAALDIVDALLQEDYQFVTVSELARLRGIRPKPGNTYKKFPPETREVK